MNLVRFHFSILRYTWAFSIFVPAAHKPTVSYILDSILIFCLFYKIVGEDGVEPPEPLSNWFTASTATPTEYSPRTRTPRVSNDFFVLCVPLSGHCFVRLFASTGNTRDDFLVIVVCSTKLIWILYTYVPYKDLHLLKTHHAKCALHQALQLRDTCWPENGICLGYAVSHLYGYRSKALNQQVFSICITDKWHSGKKWKFRDSNPRPTGYEPVALTNWAKFPE